MYADTKRIRDNRVTIRLDDYEHALIKALADYQGNPPATLVRELVMREAINVLGSEPSVLQLQL